MDHIPRVSLSTAPDTCGKMVFEWSASVEFPVGVGTYGLTEVAVAGDLE